MKYTMRASLRATAVLGVDLFSLSTAPTCAELYAKNHDPLHLVSLAAGFKMTWLDKLIASHRARSLWGGALVTNNEADFVNYAGLVVENWVNNH